MRASHRVPPAWRPLLCTVAMLALLAAAYWPGLRGGFLFDDFSSLDQLGRYGGVHDWTRFLYFLTSGEADPTGRPVAQLSWLLDARDWPADPWPFKRTNLLLHLGNGVLLLLLLRRLQRWLHAPGGDRATRDWTPLLATTLWLAHPLWVSTTLYIVQRQAMLATTFVLLGLLAWDTAYRQLRAGARGRGWAWLALGVGGATLLAGLSKANGFLLPLLALALWWSIQSRSEAALEPRQRRSLRVQLAAGLGLPALAIVGYLLAQIPAAIRRAAAVRDFSLGERLLSQPRALLEYLGLLVVPREGSGGVFNDGFAVSHGLLDPWTTLPALVVIAALVAAGFAARTRWPRWSAALLFFFAGHLMESGPVPLELYFEHRNYLPALLVIAALVAAGFAARTRWPRWSAALLFFFAGHLMESGPVPLELYFEHRNYLPALLLSWPLAHALLAPGQARRARRALALALPVILLVLTWQRATLWGDPPLQALVWAQRNPDSARAQAYAAETLAAQGRTAEAQRLLQRAQQHLPGQSLVALNRVAQACHDGAAGTADLDAATQALRAQRLWNQGTLDWLSQLHQEVLAGRCPALGTAGWQRLIAEVAANPTFNRSPARLQALYRMQGRAALAARNPDAALAAFDRGLDLEPKPQVALAQAADLGNAGYEAWALRHLDHYAALDVHDAPRRIRSMADVHRWLLLRTGYYQGELDHLRRLLQEAVAGRPANSPTENAATGKVPADPAPARRR